MRSHDLYTSIYVGEHHIECFNFVLEIHFQDSWNSHNLIEAKYTYRRASIVTGICNDMLYFYVGAEILSFSRWMIRL
jgi:hypothetical protein